VTYLCERFLQNGKYFPEAVNPRQSKIFIFYPASEGKDLIAGDMKTTHKMACILFFFNQSLKNEEKIIKVLPPFKKFHC
jgi:hypothetical protein